MRDDICTIPVSEVFEIDDGCPICRMRRTVENHIIDYIMGAAMMEPDVRIETNKTGFCPSHYDMMLNHKGRLSLALMLETHLDFINDDVLSFKLFETKKKKAEKAGNIYDKCFVCDKINWGMERMIDTLYRCYETERDFRNMFDNQSMFCIPHYELLVGGANKRNMPKYHGEFVKSITETVKECSKSLSKDVKNYCKVYSYQNNKDNCDWENAKDSVERSIAFLTGRSVDK